MTERKLINELTNVCEALKTQGNGFIWLTHQGHWRSPDVVAVFTTERQRNNALSDGWDEAFITQVTIALESIKSTPNSIRFDSEEACDKQSQGDWEKHLSKPLYH